MHTKNRILCLILLIIVLGMPGITSAEKRFLVESAGMTLSCPDDWEFEERSTPVFEVMLVLLSPSKPDTHEFRENVIIGVQSLSMKLSSKEYMEKNLEIIRRDHKNFHLVSSLDVAIDGMDACRIIGTNSPGESGEKTRIMQYYLMRENRGFIITCTDSDKNFQKHQPVFEKIADSIKFK